MTMEPERIFKSGFKYSNAGRDSTRKRKHLVAAALLNATFSTGEKDGNQSTNRLVAATSMAFTTILVVATWVCSGRNHDDVGDTSGALIGTQIASHTALPCSGQGYYLEFNTATMCKCHECFEGVDCAQVVDTCVIDLDHGDPTVFENFWFRNGAASVTVILGYQRMSYFAHSQHVWFMEKDLDEQIRRLHRLVGNAVTHGRHIVVGTGSTQVFQAALFALTSPDQPTPTKIVSTAPFYSSYPAVTDYMRSALFHWAGDAAKFNPENAENEGQPYIELVTSPNNPDGRIQHAVVRRTTKGHVVHDLAYYWPHYTPIIEAADHDIMLFTLSKSTGHAGTRIGWAILKDEAVAKKMMKFVELNTIGVSHDSQVRATQVVKAVLEGYASRARTHLLQQQSLKSRSSSSPHLDDDDDDDKLFHFGSAVMQYRWTRLRAALNASSEFAVPDFEPSWCNFFGKEVDHTPAFAWLRCLKAADCEEMLKARRIGTRSGRHFGVGAEFVRLSMLDRNRKFEMLMDRLAKIDSSRTPG